MYKEGKTNLYYERCKRGMTLKELGKEIGVTDAQISRLENGSRKTSVKTGFKLSEFFKKDINYLLAIPSKSEVVR